MRKLSIEIDENINFDRNINIDKNVNIDRNINIDENINIDKNNDIDKVIKCFVFPPPPHLHPVLDLDILSLEYQKEI